MRDSGERFPPDTKGENLTCDNEEIVLAITAIIEFSLIHAKVQKEEHS